MADKLILGCGYLGRRVAALWRAQGHRVFATTRQAARGDELRALGCEPLLCDVLDRDSLRHLPAVETLLYCVGLDRAVEQSMRRVYVEGLANVLDALTAKAPARFVYVSSTSVYGQTDGEEVDENAATEPLEETGLVALEAERLLRGRWPSAVVLRFAGIYGPDRLLRAEAIRAGELIVGDADHWLNLIHVEDGAAAVVAAAERGTAGAVYNVSDGRPVTRREFYERLALHLGAPPPRFAAPALDATVAYAEHVNRRISNRKMGAELGVKLRYASYEAGLKPR
jgi:nucleoside-diphosphate-sugar epimerase